MSDKYEENNGNNGLQKCKTINQQCTQYRVYERQQTAGGGGGGGGSTLKGETALPVIVASSARPAIANEGLSCDVSVVARTMRRSLRPPLDSCIPSTVSADIVVSAGTAGSGWRNLTPAGGGGGDGANISILILKHNAEGGWTLVGCAEYEYCDKT